MGALPPAPAARALSPDLTLAAALPPAVTSGKTLPLPSLPVSICTECGTGGDQCAFRVPTTVRLLFPGGAGGVARIQPFPGVEPLLYAKK